MDPILARSACVYLHRLAWLYYTLVFDLFFDIDFLPSWSDFGSQLGSFLATFSVLSWGSILKSIFYRFVIDFWSPWHLKNWAPAYTRIKFSSFYSSYLTLPFGLCFGTQNVSKIEPKMLQNLFRYKVKCLISLEVDFVATWLQLGPQLGGQQRNIGSIFSNLKSFKIHLGPSWAPRPAGIDFWSIFDQFLINFWSIFDRFFIDCWSILDPTP